MYGLVSHFSFYLQTLSEIFDNQLFQDSITCSFLFSTGQPQEAVGQYPGKLKVWASISNESSNDDGEIELIVLKEIKPIFWQMGGFFPVNF